MSSRRLNVPRSLTALAVLAIAVLMLLAAGARPAAAQRSHATAAASHKSKAAARRADSRSRSARSRSARSRAAKRLAARRRACVIRRAARHRRAGHRRLGRHARVRLRRACAREARRTTRTTKKRKPAPAPAPAPAPEPAPSPTDPAPVAPAAPTALAIAAVDAGTARLDWPATAAAARVQVLRDGVLVDEIDGAVTSYVDRALWQRTTYTYDIRAVDAAGAELARWSSSVTTPARTSFARLFSDSAFVNQRAGTAPELEPASSSIVASSITPYVGNANFSNSDSWGIPVVQADAATPLRAVACLQYTCSISFPDFPLASAAKPSTGSDHHLAVLDAARGKTYDMWGASRSGDAWSAKARWVVPTDGSGTNCPIGQRCGGSDAASWPLVTGLVRPEEIAQGRIDHALVITTPYIRSGVVACPAANTDGRVDDPAAIPMGARVQLDPSLDVDALALPAWQKVIARALQEYGAYVGDTGGSLAIRAESNLGRGYDAWSKAGVPNGSPNVSALPWNRLRVLRVTRC